MRRQVSNPPNPWATRHVEWLGEPPAASLRVSEELAKSLVSENDSPDVPFRYSANAYRGCAHACSYCYARPTHEYLGLGAGTDFETEIVVKTNAAEVLAEELGRPSWKREVLCLSGVTDPYQPLEASYGLTRQLLEVCLARSTPVVLLTKGALVRRDIDLLQRLHRRVGVKVHLSIAFARSEVARAMDPGAPTPRTRFETLAALSAAGLPTGISISPLIPGLNESDLPELLDRAAAAGARTVFSTLLRLPGPVAPVFEQRLRAAFPGRAEKVLSGLRQMRGGELYDPRFGKRMQGQGDRWQVLQRLLEVKARQLGLEVGEVQRPALPAVSAAPQQGELFA